MIIIIIITSSELIHINRRHGNVPGITCIIFIKKPSHAKNRAISESIPEGEFFFIFFLFPHIISVVDMRGKPFTEFRVFLKAERKV